MENPTDHMRNFKNLSFNDGETIKAFNLRFMKLFNKIPKVIIPTRQVSLAHNDNNLPLSYRHQLEENGIKCLGSTMQTCLEFEEHNLRIGLFFGNFGPKTDMFVMLQMM
jgi:hypothetical protein